MPLGSTSTLAEIQAAFDDNASYYETGDAAKARAFVTACRLLLRRTPKSTGTREGSVEMSPEVIERMMREAREWLEANDQAPAPGGGTVPTVTRADFRDFRC